MDSSSLFKAGKQYQIQVLADEPKMRIDLYLNHHFPLYSRTFFQKLIEQGKISINGTLVSKAGMIVKPDDRIELSFPPERIQSIDQQKVNDLAITIVFEHPHFFIINKPAGVMVHPAASTPSTVLTLTDWLVQQDADIREVGAVDRPGIVHRLDKDTSGLLIVPRTNHAHTIFGDMFKNRQIAKTYYAIVSPATAKPAGTINFSIARDRHTKIKMAFFKPSYRSARSAITHYQTIQLFKSGALLEVKPVTGRTHQIRVHCLAIGSPIIGDTVYGNASSLINRQALHAGKLEFTFDGEFFSFQAPLPEDMEKLIEQLAAE